MRGTSGRLHTKGGAASAAAGVAISVGREKWWAHEDSNLGPADQESEDNCVKSLKMCSPESLLNLILSLSKDEEAQSAAVP